MSRRVVSTWLGLMLAVGCGRGPHTVPVPDSGGLPTGECVDNDGDGFVGTGDCSAVPAAQLDCNDEDPSIHPGAVEVCNGKDDDCDGRIDNVRGTPNPITRGCWDGPPTARGVGACKDGAQACTAGSWGTCQGETLPVAEKCNGIDDDCDGKVDNVPGTTTAISQNCYTADAGLGVGPCKGGNQSCVAGGWGTCFGEVVPMPEQCNGIDDDCDGKVDNIPGTSNPITQSCYTGPAGTANVGACKPGTATCASAKWGACTGQITPVPEVCNGIDDDCDGRVDNIAGTGTPLSLSCYSGPAGTAGVGVCKAGAQVCTNGIYGNCTGQVLPSTEVCNGLDDDCDGRVDNVPGTANPLSQTCYTGPAGTLGVGVCAAGNAYCTGGSYGACTGQVIPSAELCNGLDDDCDGHVDNVPGTTNPITEVCYDGPPGTAGQGVCKSGMATCASGSWGTCVGEQLPTPPACDGLDNNCNGIVDEPFVSSTSTLDATNAWTDIAFAPYYYSSGSCAGGVNGSGTDVLAGGALVGTTFNAIYFQKLDASGNPVGGPVKVNSSGYDVVGIAQAGDGFMLAGVWNGDHYSIDAYYVDSSGNVRTGVLQMLSSANSPTTLTNQYDSLRLVRGNGKRVSVVFREFAAGSHPDSTRQGVWLMSFEPIIISGSWELCDPATSPGYCPPSGTKYGSWMNTSIAQGMGADSTHQDWVVSQSCPAASTMRHLAVAYLWKPPSAFANCPAGSSCASYFDVMEDGTAAPSNVFPGTGMWGESSPRTITEPELVYYLPASGIDQWLTAWVKNDPSAAPPGSDMDFWMTSAPSWNFAYLANATDNGAASVFHPRATATASDLLLTAIRYVPDPSGLKAQMMSRHVDFSGNRVPGSQSVELSALTGSCGPAQCRPGNKQGLASWASQNRIFYSGTGSSPTGTYDSVLTCN